MFTKMVQYTFLLSTFLLITGNAHACECEYSDEILNELKQTADFIFIGSAVSNFHYNTEIVEAQNTAGYGSNVFFKIDDLIKGDAEAGQNIFIYQESSSCEQDFVLNKKYLVIGYSIKSFESIDCQSVPPPPSDIDTVKICNDLEKVRFLNNKSSNGLILTTNVCGVFVAGTDLFNELLSAWGNE